MAAACASCAAWSGGCGNSTTTGLAIGAGTMAGVGVLDVGATHSRLSVKISRFNARRDPSKKVSDDLTPDFGLGHPLALQAAADRRGDPVVSAGPRRLKMISWRISGNGGEGAATESKIGGQPSLDERVKSAVIKLGQVRDSISNPEKIAALKLDREQQADLQKVAASYGEAAEKHRKLSDAISKFEARAGVVTPGSDVGVKDARLALLDVRHSAIDARKSLFSDEIVALYRSALRGELEKVTPPEEMPNLMAVLPRIGANASMARRELLVRTLNSFGELVNASEGKAFGAAYRQAFNGVLERVPLGIGGDEVLEAVKEKRLDEALREAGPRDFAGAADGDLIDVTLDGFTTSLSLGPIENEVMQMITAHKAIEDITDPDNKGRWVPFSEAEAFSGAGDSTNVVYLENMATPVLKSSKFDPTQFIAAEGKLFKNAFNAVVGALGPNVPGTGGTGTSGGTGSTAIPNLQKIKADTEAAKNKLAKAREKVLAAMQAAIDADVALRSDFGAGTDSWTGNTVPTADLQAAQGKLDDALKDLKALQENP